MKYYTHSLLILALMAACLTVVAQEDESWQTRLSFLEGTWNTLSVYPDTGVEAPGMLTYEWVLGGAWMKFTFIGDHPQAPIWEAHGMMGWENGSLVSYAFFSADPPVHYAGSFLEDGTFRIELNNDGTRSGIDYSPTENGGVYQENWLIDSEGKRHVRLKTTYTRIEK